MYACKIERWGEKEERVRGREEETKGKKGQRKREEGRKGDHEVVCASCRIHSPASAKMGQTRSQARSI